MRRVPDRELASTIDEIAGIGDRLKKSLDEDLKKDTTTNKPARQAIISQADQFAKDAKSLRDRVKDGDPSSGEGDRVVASARKLQAFIESHPVPAAAGVWREVTVRLQRVASAYGTSWPG